jgi:5-methyltetrahydrofolate--homocysteine methyltransferase
MTPPNPFLARLQSGKPIVLDGATGTNLQARGLERGQPGEFWLMEHPEQIVQLHRDFIAAGSDLILTCSFGGTSLRLEHIGMAGRVAEVNQRAVMLAREAAEGTDTLVAGSIGPTGQLLKPFGALEPAEAEAAFAGQARVLSEAGVDALVIETQFDFSEAESPTCRWCVPSATTAAHAP